MGDYKLILTFDDGPLDDRKTTEDMGASLKQIITTLNKRNATGVFYVLGQEVRLKPDLARLIVDKGHIIQNHSWKHDHLPTLSRDALKKDLQDTQEIIKKHTGRTPDRLRPPYGDGYVYNQSATLAEVAQELRLTLTGWDIDTNDWKSKDTGLQSVHFSPKRERWKELYDTREAPLDILMHVQKATASALGSFLDSLTREGWTYTTYDGTQPQSSNDNARQAPKTTYYIQAGAFSTRDAQTRTVQQLRQSGFSNVRIVEEKGKPNRVQVGPYADRAAAEKVLATLKKMFVNAFIKESPP